MKKLYITILISIIFSFLKTHAQNHPLLISEYSNASGKYATKINYQYDNKNRLIKKIVSQYEINEKGEWNKTNDLKEKPITFAYYQDSIVSTADGSWLKIILNRNGLFEKDVAVNEFSKTNALTNRLTRSYNQDGFLIKEILFDDYVTYSTTSTTEYEYKNGNLTKESTKNRRVNQEGEVWENSGILEYEYFKNTTNSIGNTNFGTSYLGRSSRNLVQNLKNENGYAAYYEYDFDPKGNVTKRTLIRIADCVKMSEENYKYQ